MSNKQKQKNMKTKKAFIAKNRVYPTKDAAILCTGSKDVTVVNIREDYKFMMFEPEVYFEDDILFNVVWVILASLSIIKHFWWS